MRGRAAHSAIAPQDGVNAIVPLARAIAAFPESSDAVNVNVALVAGRVGDERGARRLPGDGRRAGDRARRRGRRWPRRSSRPLRVEAERAGCQVEIEIDRPYSAYRLAPDSRALRLALAAFARLGLEAAPWETRGGSDANVFCKRGLDCVNLTHGVVGFHAPDERVAVSDLELMRTVMLAIIAEAAGPVDGVPVESMPSADAHLHLFADGFRGRRAPPRREATNWSSTSTCVSHHGIQRGLVLGFEGEHALPGKLRPRPVVARTRPWMAPLAYLPVSPPPTASRLADSARARGAIGFAVYPVEPVRGRGAERMAGRRLGRDAARSAHWSASTPSPRRRPGWDASSVELEGCTVHVQPPRVTGAVRRIRRNSGGARIARAAAGICGRGQRHREVLRACTASRTPNTTSPTVRRSRSWT